MEKFNPVQRVATDLVGVVGIVVAECAAALAVSPKTISNHQSQIKEKLATPTTAGLVHLALRHAVVSM